MTATAARSEVSAPAALADRLATVVDVLTGGAARTPVGSDGLHDLLLESIVAAQEAADRAAAWLLTVGLTAAYPTTAVVTEVQRALELQEPDALVLWLLGRLRRTARDGQAQARLRVVDDRPLVDVDRTAKSNFLTGIQRVVKGVAMNWVDELEMELVVWSHRGSGYRALRPAERRRLLATVVGDFDASQRDPVSASQEIIVPWRVPIVLTEVPAANQSDRLCALAPGVASLRLVGYDCIPVSSAETVPAEEPEKFGHYLELVKRADRLAAISETAAAEFTGFNRALSAQGLRGPTVTPCPLPTVAELPDADEVADAPDPTGRPLVVTLGTVGRRKNQAVLVEAAELLWRDGLDFEVRILGHVGAERTPLVGLVPELVAEGRPLTVESGVSDSRIAASFAAARCSVFVSLHEGFGLPVVESLSAGVPVIASDFGSVREVAQDHGCLLVDPTDVDAVARALRSLLVDDELHAGLVREARDRPLRSWRDYADDLRDALLA